jgi:iron(III) transport system permease protein
MSIFELVSGATGSARWGRRSARFAGRRPSVTTLLYGAALFVVGLMLLVPVYLLVRAMGAGQESVETLLSSRAWGTMGNTLLLAGAVVLASAALAVPLAWLTTASDLPYRRAWSVLVALPLVIPSYVAAYLYISLLSPRGIVQGWLAPLGVDRLPPIYGFTGAWLVLTLIAYPYIFLTVRAALQRMDPSLLEAARSLGLSPRRAFWRVTLPNLRPSLLAGSLLVALYCVRDFGAVNLLQQGTFTRVIFNRYQAFRLDEAAALSLLLVGLTAVLLWLDYRSRGRAHYTRLSAGCARVSPPARLGAWKLPALLFVGGVVFLALLVPAGGLAYWLWRGLSQDGLVRDLAIAQSNVAPLGELLRPAWHSLAVSLGAAGLTVALALPVSVLAVRKPGRASSLLERLTYTSSALPGLVVALAFVFIGANYAPALYQTLPMLLAAYVVLYLPQAVGSQRSSLLQVSPKLEEAGRSLGGRPWSVFRRITLPLLRPGLLAAGAMIFLSVMKELPATLILSPIGFDTLAGQVWTNIGEAFFARAAVPTLLLILLSSLPLALFTLRDGDNHV